MTDPSLPERTPPSGEKRADDAVALVLSVLDLPSVRLTDYEDRRKTFKGYAVVLDDPRTPPGAQLPSASGRTEGEQ